MEVGRDKLGLPGDGEVDILNVKSDPMLIGSYRTQEGLILSTDNMNKERWISILLEEPDLDDTIPKLLALVLILSTPQKSKIV